jgi:hypothetical protein
MIIAKLSIFQQVINKPKTKEVKQMKNYKSNKPDYSNLKPRDPYTGEEVGNYTQEQAEKFDQTHKSSPQNAVAKDYKHPLPFSGDDIDEYANVNNLPRQDGR